MSAPLETIPFPPFPGIPVATLSTTLDEGADPETGVAVGLQWSEDLGSPLVFNRVVVDSNDGFVIPVDGTVTFVPLPAFRRGELNGDSQLLLGDAVFLLSWAFGNGPTPDCIKAADIE